MKIVAKALLIDSSGNLLILNRGVTHPHFPGHYDLPGGEVEEGESLDVAVAREILEEAGISIHENQLEKVFERQYPTLLHVLYVANLSSERPNVTLSWEHSNFQWITLEGLLDLPLPDGVDKYYIDVINHLKSTISTL